MSKTRCDWVRDDPTYLEYHDHIWGVPIDNEPQMFKMLSLEGFQAGLSWITILKKQAALEAQFSNFDVYYLTRLSNTEIDRAMKNPKIIRNRKKIESLKSNAIATVKLWDNGKSLCEVFWKSVSYRPKINHYKDQHEIPTFTECSIELSKELKKLGYRFVGPTIIYAHMQASGLVNDHQTNCFRFREINEMNANYRWP